MYPGNAEKGVVFFNILNLQKKNYLNIKYNASTFFFEMFKQVFTDFKFTENSDK